MKSFILVLIFLGVMGLHAWAKSETPRLLSQHSLAGFTFGIGLKGFWTF